MNAVTKKEKGFTIIEVVLVLAIAGLIFLVVFLALPALQRSQRDTQRRSDASRISSLVTSYQSNNNGKLPGILAAEVTAFAADYLKNPTTDGSGTTGELRSPSTNNNYALAILASAVTPVPVMTATVESVQIAVGAKCNGEVLTASAGKYAVRVRLETGGVYCVGSN